MPDMPRIYLDVCCLNRPFDDQTQDRIRLEAEAVLLILTHFENGDWEWVGSEVLDWEIDQTPDPDRRHRVRILAARAHSYVRIEQSEIERAYELEGLGLKAFDALHIACAESNGVDVFLTTDDRLLRLASRFGAQIRVQVVNPLTWLKEVLEK